MTRFATVRGYDPTLELSPGPWGGPRGGGLFLVSEVPLKGLEVEFPRLQTTQHAVGFEGIFGL
jgi:hypothetical protein